MVIIKDRDKQNTGVDGMFHTHLFDPNPTYDSAMRCDCFLLRATIGQFSWLLRDKEHGAVV